MLTLQPEALQTDNALSMWEQAVLTLVREAARSGHTVMISTEPKLFTPDEAAHQLMVSRSTISRRIADGDIHSVKVGNRHRIPYSEVRRIWDQQMTAVAQASAADIETELFGNHE